MPGSRWLLAAAALSALAAPAEGAVALRHEPLACVPANRYALVSAAGEPAGQVAGLTVQFRTDAAGGWYGVAMANENGTWSARLPRPAAALAAFEYRLLLTSTAAEVTEGPVHPVRVAPPEECEAPSARPSIATPILVNVPPGAPLVPPVPAGFNPTGVVAAQPPPRPPSKAGKIGLGAVAAVVGGAAAAGVLLAAGPEPPPPPLPTFSFNGTTPQPGSVLSLSRTPFAVFVLLSHPPHRSLNLEWRVELLREGSGPLCVVMQSVYTAAIDTRVTLTAPMAATGTCGERFTVIALRLIMQMGTSRVYDALHALPFEVEP
ncbi:MAG TPA: hypothetical protein VFO85_20900 [Vicinamibacteria bacterium]|nr:hypothetical protein [Vicinamibacteria bacterium]